jgi:integrase
VRAAAPARGRRPERGKGERPRCGASAPRLDYPDTDRIFTWEDGRDVHPDTIRQRFNRLSERCGLPHIWLYDIRHTYATTALKSGVPKIVSTRLGHASVAFTLDVYSHALPEMDRDAAHEIASMFVDDDQADEQDGVSKSVSKDEETPDQDDL